ncbi:unnamed protein product [Rhizophagus irregularis]|nr:unnamed protein product [Rhizophagus irregularis]
MLQQRHSQFIQHPTIDTLLNTTHIVGFKENRSTNQHIYMQHASRSSKQLLTIPSIRFRKLRTMGSFPFTTHVQIKNKPPILRPPTTGSTSNVPQQFTNRTRYMQRYNRNHH